MRIDNDIRSQFQMIGSRIVNLNIKNSSISSNLINQGRRNLSVSHEVKSVDLHDDTLIGVVHLQVTIRVVWEEDKYAIKLVLEGGFSAPLEMGEDAFTKMLSLNGIASLYGIARAQISTITALTFADGALLLPMIDVTRYSKNLSEKNE